jgi:hypothetical protein
VWNEEFMSQLPPSYMLPSQPQRVDFKDEKEKTFSCPGHTFSLWLSVSLASEAMRDFERWFMNSDFPSLSTKDLSVCG